MAAPTAHTHNTVFPPPDAVAALCAHPGLPAAMRRSAGGIASMYQGGHLLNWLVDDRGRVLFAYFALYLYLTRDPADPASGLTPTRMKAMCAEFGICSAGRAGAMLSLMRFAGYLAPDIQVVDRRQRRLVATEKLFNLMIERWRVHFTAMAPLLPDGAALLRALDDRAFIARFAPEMVARFRAGFRPAEDAPELRLFGERNAGMLLLMSLVAAGEADDTVPPSRAVRMSLAGLARRFSVSRQHIVNVMREAERDGLITREGDRVTPTPVLVDGTRKFFANLFLFFADCARTALRDMEPGGKAVGNAG